MHGSEGAAILLPLLLGLKPVANFDSIKRAMMRSRNDTPQLSVSGVANPQSGVAVGLVDMLAE